MRLCGYCGDRVVWRDGYYRHTTTAPRLKVTPGDYVSAAHNTAGTRVGGYDIVGANVRAYMMLSLRSEKDDRSVLDGYTLQRATGGAWRITLPRPRRKPTRRVCLPIIAR